MATYHSSFKRRKKSKWKRLSWTILLLLILAGGGFAYLAYTTVFGNNVWVKEGEEAYLYIGKNDDFAAVKEKLYQHGHILNRKSFEFWADYKKYPSVIKSGRYKLYNAMSNNELINLLRSGQQEAVKLTFNNIRLKEDLAANISKQLDFDSIDLIRLLYDNKLSADNGFNRENILCMFIPNTYFVYWNSSEDIFYQRMQKEYNTFWNKDRRQKAANLNMSPIEVSILASIVEKETQQNDEKARVAGVYLNRLKAGWRLQADPTLVFALGNFTIRRVLNVHKDIESPYNTYKHSGLPPGPICMPSVSSIDAVLNAEQHSYMFFCAKPDFSGHHNFAKTARQHKINAKAYQRFLNTQKVFN